MKTFRCQCGNNLYFENSRCLACNRVLGYLPDQRQLSALEPAGDGVWSATANGRRYRQCGNYEKYQVCNWMVPVGDDKRFCVSCRLNHIIPNLREPENLTLWHRIETAKRRLIYTLHGLGLPIVGRDEDPERGLAFEFLADDDREEEFSNRFSGHQRVITGHRAGMITINIAEAKDAAREEMREKMNEGYRTLLGHFRHESGHYYWDRLIAGSPRVDTFRRLFGDERVNYDETLRRYYGQGPAPSWPETHISAYASAHPWEDWSETWAHYLHMVDTMETAHDFGFTINGREMAIAGSGQRSAREDGPEMFEILVAEWRQLTLALNALNRSMGLNDAYPFHLSDRSCAKLRFVHEVIADVS